jgi:NAD(P)-dependent dehydrogenase (short-subunit alcohol dehydrogenase family)
MEINFQGKVVLVTGGTGGLGHGVSQAFLSEGATVIATYRDPKEFAALQAAAGDRFQNLQGAQTDVTKDSSAAALVQDLILKHGRLDVVIHTVGGYAGGIKLWELEPAVFDRMLNLNLRSGFAMAQATIPAMLKQGSGVLINISARAAVDHAAGASAYAASKAAAVALMDSLAADLKGTGVRVNSVLPSIIDTEANRKAMPDAPFDKWPKPDEIADVLLFLASDKARLIHGASIPVYGQN